MHQDNDSYGRRSRRDGACIKTMTAMEGGAEAGRKERKKERERERESEGVKKKKNKKKERERVKG